jgi:hypothetical protein
MIDYTGRRFTRLVVIREAERRNGHRYWLCRCDCGTEKTVQKANLQSGTTRSCGCLQKEEITKRRTVHGHTVAKRNGKVCQWSSEYTAWAQMKQRCYNPKEHNYARYGGRGIRVADEWRNNFEAFFAHIGPRPSELHSLDRIDNNKNYEPGNVRWATKAEQQQNRECARTVTIGDTVVPISALAKQCGIDTNVLAIRILVYGWSVERAMTTPKRKCTRRSGVSHSHTPE